MKTDRKGAKGQRMTNSAYRGVERRKAPRPPDNACTTCGTLTLPHRGSLTLPVNGEVMSVPGCTYLLCSKCGEKLISYEQAGYLWH